MLHDPHDPHETWAESGPQGRAPGLDAKIKQACGRGALDTLRELLGDGPEAAAAAASAIKAGALDSCVKSDHGACVAALLDADPSGAGQEEARATALRMAAIHDAPRCGAEFIKRGSPRSVRFKGETALGVAFVYLVVVENLVRGFIPPLRPYLLGENVAALLNKNGIDVYTGERFVPGSPNPEQIVIHLSNLRAGLTLTAGVMVFVLIATALFRRRDLT